MSVMSGDEAAMNDIQRAASEQFARQSHRYGKGHILADVADVDAALATVPMSGVRRVLDVATGGGHTGLHLASLGHDVTLSDLTDAMLDRAREAAEARGLKVSCARHPAERMPYANGTFDLVTCRVAPHHFSAPEQFVAEVARVLIADGHFVLIDGSVHDDEPEAEAWLHSVEKLRDPSHHRFLTPREWTQMCESAGLRVEVCRLTPRKQPDLEWYFETAATPPENRDAVREFIVSAPESARRLFRIGDEDGKTIWWWPMLTLVARR
jgi:ubiquinone/menaquinone biosynthesis C-methylase UbiE